jgi:hypothetical protein
VNISPVCSRWPAAPRGAGREHHDGDDRQGGVEHVARHVHAAAAGDGDGIRMRQEGQQLQGQIAAHPAAADRQDRDHRRQRGQLRQLRGLGDVALFARLL